MAYDPRVNKLSIIRPESMKYLFTEENRLEKMTLFCKKFDELLEIILRPHDPRETLNYQLRLFRYWNWIRDHKKVNDPPHLRRLWPSDVIDMGSMIRAYVFKGPNPY